MIRAGDQKAVISTFRHDTSRNLDPALHTHSVIANMLKGGDGKWRTMANESLYASKMLLGAMYRSELAGALRQLGYAIEKTHADGRFEIAGVSRETVEAFSTRRAEIEAAMDARGLGMTGQNPHLAGRAALMTRAHKRDVDKEALRDTWQKQASDLGFDAKGLVASAMQLCQDGAENELDRERKAGREPSSGAARQADLLDRAARAEPAREAVDWALAHLSERDAVFSNNELLSAALAFNPGAASVGEIERTVGGLVREGINAHIRERLAREGRIAGPVMEAERLVSEGYTKAEKALAANYAVGDVVAFNRPYKRLGVEKGDERRVVGVDHRERTVQLEGPNGSVVDWKPSHIGGRRGGTEVYRTEAIELRAGDRIRWTRNDAGLGVVNSGVAEVTAVRKGRVSFRLEDGRRLDLGKGDAQLRHLDHAWASTVHAFQGRTVDNVIAAMQANHPNLTTAKSFYVEISRARDRAELVTDDAQALKERLEAATGERISALEGIGESVQPQHEKVIEESVDIERPERGSAAPSPPGKGSEVEVSPGRAAPLARGKGPDMELGL